MSKEYKKELEARSYLQGEDGMGEVQAEARMARGELQPGQPGFEQRMLSLSLQNRFKSPEVTEELERP